jgi:hypothetical protein
MAYTNIDDPSAHFQSFLYTGNGSNRTITLPGNSDLKFDLYWYKQRSQTGHHRMFDTSRGLSLELYPDLANADSSATYFNNQQANSFDIIANDSATNTGDVTFANWQWKANGGTTASNTVGNIDSVVQANTDAGFAIVTYTGNGSANQTIGHGLGAVPKMILFKNRSNSAYWYVYHVATGNDTMTYLNLNNAAQSLSSQFSTQTTTTFNVSNENSTFSGYNTNGNTYVAYVFADVQGYSKIGKYVGNGNASGPFVYTGFKPAFVMIKVTSAVESWTMFDGARKPFNRDDNVASIYANTNGAEYTGASYHNIDILSNGFKVRLTNTAVNASGASYIYMAFAENPFTTSTGIPTTAR